MFQNKLQGEKMTFKKGLKIRGYIESSHFVCGEGKKW